MKYKIYVAVKPFCVTLPENILPGRRSLIVGRGARLLHTGSFNNFYNDYFVELECLEEETKGLRFTMDLDYALEVLGKEK